ncbi:MAG: class I SAM-dependent methyltransferase, partial [Candidatus Lokiarchaeota archaeon]
MKPKPPLSDKKRKIIEDYNLSSQYYDKRYQEIQSQKYRRFFENIQIQNNIILDAGCGTGLLLEYIFQKTRLLTLIKYKYAGVDISINMLKKFQSKLDYFGIAKYFSLVLADVENLPFRDNIFDKIFSFTDFQNLVDIEKAFNDSIRSGKAKFDIIITILKKASNLEEFGNLVKKKLKKYSFDYNP